MNLYSAVVSCEIRTKRKQTLHKFAVQDFNIPVAANNEVEAAQIIQITFPWTYYKHVKVKLNLLAENV